MKKLFAIITAILLVYISSGGMKKEMEITEIPILMYHNFTEDSSKITGATITPDKFRNDMKVLKNMGYKSFFIKDLINYKEGKLKIDKKPVFITLDDGYQSNYDYAYKILKEEDMKATVSIVGWSVGRTDYVEGTRERFADLIPFKPHFTWETAKEMQESGVIDIQHHTYDLHNPEGISFGEFNQVAKGVLKMKNETDEEYEKRFTEDIKKLKDLIKEKLGKETLVFTYPYGISSEKSEEVLKKLGFKATIVIGSKVAKIDESIYKLNRYNVDMNTNLENLLGGN